MRLVHVIVSALASTLFVPSAVSAQTLPLSPAVSVPKVINLSGVFTPADGQPPAAVEAVTLSIYTEAEGGTPIWQETQSVAIDAEGRYTLLLGATHAGGIPREVFASGEAQWLGTVFARPGEMEGRRVRITSVPYALRASDADTLGGRPAAAYVLAPTVGSDAGAGSSAATAAGDESVAGVTPNAVLPGTENFLAKYVNANDVGISAVYEAGGRVGINTGAVLPADYLHVKFNDPFGAFTGIAVQNINGGGNASSGFQFFNHLGSLVQFMGYSNVSNEFRINNIGSNGAINFLTNSNSRFFVASNGTVGIGTTAPAPTSNLDVSNAVSGSGTTNVNVTTYSPNGFGPNLIGRKARGTQGAPTSVLNNDALLLLSGNGYGATGFASVNSAGIAMRASENWTDTAQGSSMSFSTTANGTTVSNQRMTINSNGNVGIGVFGAQANLEVSNANGLSGAGTIFTTTFTNAGTSLFVGRRARGTGLAPTAVLSGDPLVGYLAQGYGTSAFSGTRGGMFVVAAENWTNTAQGTRLAFNTTATGTNTPGTKMTIDPAGNVGIGTTTPSATVEAVRDGDVAAFGATSFSDGCCAGFTARLARGTAAAPAPVQLGDPLALFLGDGYGATDFSSEGGGMIILAAENWTDTAQGTIVASTTTPLGSTEDAGRMAIMPNGNVGIGTFTEIPTIADKLQVFGDIRVGTSGTNGCINNFAGAGLIGTCSSDRRLKKNIIPFGPVLDQLTSLQPVHYFWRAAEFPERLFGNSQNLGLIAQDVEQVLPELVETDSDGFKAVNYSKLPLLTIQAVKELKAEKDALEGRNLALERRVSELERLIERVLSAAAR